MTQLPSFSERLLTWFDEYGRTSLPWQQDKTPYRVWVSEIMLQQTQVSTVIPYYTRFMSVYPSVTELAEAPLDDVLSLWTGLGYYARARNMHRTAQMVVSDFGGKFPSSVEALEALPGIGRSTAGAIVTLGHGGWAPILDGNVKRVLARFHAIEGWPGKADVLSALWAASESHTPTRRTGDYTQGIMDLGATLCTKSNPGCLYCPMTADCKARIENRTADFPGKKPKKAIPVRSTFFLQCIDVEGRILLERRPPTGIWGGLWSFPEIEEKAEVADWLSDNGLTVSGNVTEQSRHSHTFSHFKLDITPIRYSTEPASSRISERDSHRWFTIDEALALGLPAPVLKMLNTLTVTD
jgi:A/G-specific adenine glycosylase